MTKKIDDLLTAGQLAKVKLYQAYLIRIKDGEKLSASDMKSFQLLEKEIEGQIDEGKNATEKIETSGKAAEYLGVSKRMISYHLTKGNLKQNVDGTFDVEELERFRARYTKKKKVSIDDKKAKADLRWRLARAEREEIITAQLKGELIPLKDAIEKETDLMMSLAHNLTIYEDRLPPQLEGKTKQEMRIIIHKENNHFRMQYKPKTI